MPPFLWNTAYTEDSPMSYKLKKKIAPWCFIAPFLLVFLVFAVYPVFYSVVLSFGTYKASRINLSGLKNYSYLLSDKSFLQSIINTFKIGLIQVPVMVFLALVLACFLNSKLVKGKGFFRMAIFIPVLIDAVSYSVIFSLLFNDQGFINSIVAKFGFTPASWYTNPWLATMMIVIAQTWKWTGYNTIIILSGLQNIPAELYEAAAIDGANRIQQFARITMPLLRHMILLVMVTSVNGAVQMFTEPNIITHGGPTGSTTTVMLYLYNMGFKNFNFGIACAGSYVVVAIVVVLTLIQMRAGKEK